MATEKMYEMAFRYKRAKLWKKMLDSELFALRLSDGEIGYCCVMSMGEGHNALALYVGDEGYQSFREMAFQDDDNFPDEENFVNAQWAFRQACLQCSFENREELDKRDARKVKEYAKAHGIQLRGPHAFPNFTKYARYRMPWGIRTREDEQRILEALDAALALAELLESNEKADLGIVPVEEDTKTLVLMIPGENGYRFSRTDVPEVWQPDYRELTRMDAESVAAVRKLRRKGVYACELLRIPGMIEADPNALEAPPFPCLLLCVDIRSGFVLTTQPTMDYEKNPETLRDMFIEALSNHGECPRAMKVRDEEVLVLLEDFCLKAGVLLSVDSDLPALDVARERILEAIYANARDMTEENEDEEGGFEFFEDENGEYPLGPEVDVEEAISEAMDQLMRMSDAELRSLPPMMVRQVLDMAPFGFVPQELQLRLRRLFKRF